MKQPAVVIGDMDLVRPLGLAAIPCVAAGPTGSETRWSRHTTGSVPLPDLWEDPEGAVDRLIAFARSHNVRPVLIYQKDPAALMISRYRTTLAEWFDFVIPRAETVEDLVDKVRFQRLCREKGLPAPETVIARPGQHDLPIDHVGFPVIVKPAIRSRSSETWRPVAGMAKAVRCDTADDLSTLFARPEIRDFPMVVQRLIPGDETKIVSYHVFIDAFGRVVGDFCGRKIRTLPSGFGRSTAVRIENLPHVRSIGLRILRAIDFTGVAKVDLKESPDGRLHLLEINPRFNLWHHPGAVAGINLPALVYAYLTSGHAPPQNPVNPGVQWVQPWGDFWAARDEGLRTHEWIRFVLRADARRACHLDDPGAFLGAMGHGLMLKLGRATRQ